MMPPNGLQPQSGNGMQRPQQGNMEQQLHAKVMQGLQSSLNQVGNGWQRTYDLGQRSAKIMLL